MSADIVLGDPEMNDGDPRDVLRADILNLIESGDLSVRIGLIDHSDLDLSELRTWVLRQDDLASETNRNIAPGIERILAESGFYDNGVFIQDKLLDIDELKHKLIGLENLGETKYGHSIVKDLISHLDAHKNLALLKRNFEEFLRTGDSQYLNTPIHDIGSNYYSQKPFDKYSKFLLNSGDILGELYLKKGIIVSCRFGIKKEAPFLTIEYTSVKDGRRTVRMWDVLSDTYETLEQIDNNSLSGNLQELI